MTIYQIQLLLLYLGYDPGEPDGVLGGKTKGAVELFQGDFGGIARDGQPGQETQKALRHAVAYGFLKRQEDFWQEIRWFSRQEFACKCGGKYCNGFPAEPVEALVRSAEQIREHFGAAITVSSGVRCTAHNANVGGVSNSRHLTGKAMDFSVAGASAERVLEYIRTMPQIRYAYAIDGSYVHMDVT